MEKTNRLKPCGHDQCGAGERVEYCQREIEDSPRDIDALITSIETVIDSDLLESVACSSPRGHEGALWGRRFEFEATSSDEFALTRVRHGVEVVAKACQQPTRWAYEVMLDWRVVSEDYISPSFQRTYKVEIYPHGSTQCTVREPDFPPEMTDATSYVDRPMTPYDVQELDSALDQLHQFERADPKFYR